MGVIGSSGYLIKTFSELKTAYQTIFQDSFGSTIDLSEESAEGVLINKLADMDNDSEQSGLDIYNNFNIKTSTGTMLDNIAILKGTTRSDGTKATIDVDLTSTSVPYTIPASSVFNILNTQTLFWNLTSVSVTATSQTIELQAKVNGKSGVIVTDKLQAQAYISGLTDIEVSSVTDGTDNESDDILRERLMTIDNPNAKGDVNAVFSALYNLTDVQKVTVLENPTDTTDENSLPPYSINSIVLGDTTQNIVDTIYETLSAGTPTYGASSGTYTDIQGYTHTCYYDRPDKVDIWIAASVTQKDGDVLPDGSYDNIIKTNCMDYINGLKIGKDVSYTSIYGFFASPNAFDITALTLSKVSATGGMAASSVTIGVREYANMDSVSNITITVV